MKRTNLFEGIKCKPDCRAKFLNRDGTFKGGFEGCVNSFEQCCTGVKDARALCASIAKGKVASARYDNEDLKTILENLRELKEAVKVVQKISCDQKCRDKFMNPDGTFKNGFKGCVESMTTCCKGIKGGEQGAKAICAAIARSKGK